MKKKTVWDLGRPSLEVFLSRPRRPVAVVLDNIRSLNNIGSIFRTCDAFAASRLLLCGITACPPSPEIHKTALGAEDSVAWSYHPSTLDAVAALRAEGYRVYALEQVHGSIPLQEWRPGPDERVAIVAGHEVDGVDPAVVDACDGCLEIPQEGTKHSLNVAVSVAIALWQQHFRRP